MNARWLVATVAALFAFNTSAQTLGPSGWARVDAAGGGQWITNGKMAQFLPGMSVTASSGSGVLVTTPVPTALSGYGTAAMSAARSVTALNAFKFVGKGIAGGIAFDLVVAPLAQLLWQQVRCAQKIGDLFTAACDAGVPPVTGTAICYSSSSVGGTNPNNWNGTCGITMLDLGNQLAAKVPPTIHATCSFDAQGNPIYGDISRFYKPGGAFAGTINSSGCGSSDLGVYANVSGSSQQTQTCPAGGAVGRDGKCKGGTLLDKTSDQLGDLIQSQLGGDFGGAGASGGWGTPADLVREQLNRGTTLGQDKAPDLLPYTTNPAPDGATLSGPASLTGTPTVVSTPAQNGQPATTSTSTPKVDLTYNGNKWTQVASTTVVNNNGTTTTTTTTTNAGGQPQPTDCDKFPNSVGCTDLGDPGAADKVPNTDYTASAGNTPFTELAGCPAGFPLNFAMAGRAYSYMLSNQPLCDLATTLKPIFIALFSASAAIIFYMGIGKAVS